MIDFYYDSIPVGREKAVTYPQLCRMWDMNERTVRQKLHEISLFDNGDGYVVIRSGQGKGFYKTDNLAEIEAFKRECIRKAKSNFAPLSKINRILRNNEEYLQQSMFNNLKNVRVGKGMLQQEVVKEMQKTEPSFDVPILSKMENGFILPTPYQLYRLSRIYDCSPNDLISLDLLDLLV